VSLKVLRDIFAGDARRQGERAPAGVINPACTEAELAKQDEHMQRYLRCSLPASYANLLREFGGMATMGTSLCGLDEPNGRDAGSWRRKGIIHATLTWIRLKDPKEPFIIPWVVIGENHFETFVISRDGKRFCAFDTAGRSRLPTTELASLDALLCSLLDSMIRSVRPTIVG
jgi:hypothetical protein